MTEPTTLDRDRYDAVLFDLDGVITDTARVHAEAWKQMFDEFLRTYSQRQGIPLQEFDIDADYKLYVDGKPRYDGVRSFLNSRAIRLEEGGPEDPPDAETVHGLGNRKNVLVNELMRTRGVDVYDTSVALLRQLRAAGVATAVVSSSRNCVAVLEAAGISDLFDARVDGEVAAAEGLAGKPAPDTFLAAAEKLGASPDRAVVVEDAISGVEAGRNGKFGLVVGVDREGNPQALRDAGADVVVSDLAELAS